MKNILWKLSKTKTVFDPEFGYLVKGNLIGSFSGKFHIVPFGGMDIRESVAYDKALSELCERAVWLQMYAIAPDLVYETPGFSSHTNSRNAIENAQTEFFERKEFKCLVGLLYRGEVQKIYNEYDVRYSSEHLFFSSRVKLPDKSLQYSVVSLYFDGNRTYFGMGKNADFQQSIIDAIDETILIKTSLDKNGRPPLESNTKIMSSGDYTLFERLSFDKTIRTTGLHLIKVIHSLHIGRSIPRYSIGDVFTINVSSLQPKFLVPLKRVVFYCFPKNRASRIVQTYLTD